VLLPGIHCAEIVVEPARQKMIVSSFWVTRKLMQRKTFFIGTRTL
jgi:hypothetical protein